MNEEPDAETIARVVKQQPMRRMQTMVCSVCKYEWVQPSDRGRCPKCHFDAAPAGDARISMLRVV